MGHLGKFSLKKSIAHRYIKPEHYQTGIEIPYVHLQIMLNLLFNEDRPIIHVHQNHLVIRAIFNRLQYAPLGRRRYGSQNVLLLVDVINQGVILQLCGGVVETGIFPMKLLLQNF